MQCSHRDELIILVIFTQWLELVNVANCDALFNFNLIHLILCSHTTYDIYIYVQNILKKIYAVGVCVCVYI